MELESKTRKIFLSFYDRVVDLFYEWKIFRQLFASGEDNLRLLNESGSNVFVLLRNLIMDDVFWGCAGSRTRRRWGDMRFLA